jgi:hypothetical protein
MKKLPVICPSCQAKLQIKSLYCCECSTSIEGLFDVPVLGRLTPEEQGFVISFVLCSGSLKEMAKNLNLSYPSVRNMLDDLIEKIKNYSNEQQA